MLVGTMFVSRLSCLLAVATLLSACREKAAPTPPPPSAPSVETLGRNLLINDDAEAVKLPETTVTKNAQKDAPEGWEHTADVTTTEYGGTADEWPDAKAGCQDGQKRYFRLALALNETSKSMHQSLAVTGIDAAIDAGQVECALGGWFGGWVDGDASAKLEVDFLGAGDKKLGTLATEAPDPSTLPKPGAGRASLMKQLTAAAVPAGTRRIEARLVAARTTGRADTNAVAAADNLSVVLRKKAP